MHLTVDGLAASALLFECATPTTCLQLSDCHGDDVDADDGDVDDDDDEHGGERERLILFQYKHVVVSCLAPPHYESAEAALDAMRAHLRQCMPGIEAFKRPDYASVLSTTPWPISADDAAAMLRHFKVRTVRVEGKAMKWPKADFVATFQPRFLRPPMRIAYAVTRRSEHVGAVMSLGLPREYERNYQSKRIVLEEPTILAGRIIRRLTATVEPMFGELGVHRGRPTGGLYLRFDGGGKTIMYPGPLIHLMRSVYGSRHVQHRKLVTLGDVRDALMRVDSVATAFLTNTRVLGGVRIETTLTLRTRGDIVSLFGQTFEPSSVSQVESTLLNGKSLSKKRVDVTQLVAFVRKRLELTRSRKMATYLSQNGKGLPNTSPARPQVLARARQLQNMVALCPLSTSRSLLRARRAWSSEYLTGAERDVNRLLHLTVYSGGDIDFVAQRGGVDEGEPESMEEIEMRSYDDRAKLEFAGNADLYNVYRRLLVRRHPTTKDVSRRWFAVHKAVRGKGGWCEKPGFASPLDVARHWHGQYGALRDKRWKARAVMLKSDRRCERE